MVEGVSARKGVNYILFMKLIAVATAILMTLFVRGLYPGLAMAIVIVPLWLLAEKMMDNTYSPSFWKSIEKREDFSRLPLAEDINKMKRAKKGQKVKQAILEGRLKEQVYYTLKNEYNLSEEEIEMLAEDPNSMIGKIDNKKLLEYLESARDLNDFKKPDGEDQVEIFSEGKNKNVDVKNDKFEEKIRSVIGELEEIHDVKEDRDR
ncbi:MAG: hypothetical protein ACLFSM_02710 [Thermoplasmata archaeon]